MKFRLDNSEVVQPHVVFAWLPVLVVDRTTNDIYFAWLEKVERRLVSIQGVAFWAYSPIKK